MDELIVGVILMFLICLSYVWPNLDKYKNWREQDYGIRLIMFHLGLGLIVSGILLFIEIIVQIVNLLS